MYLNELEDELAELAEQKPKILITSLLEFLTEDRHWFHANLTDYHKTLITKLFNEIEYL